MRNLEETLAGGLKIMLPKFRSCIFLVSRNTIVFYTSVDSCKKTAVVFDHAVSMLEFINCQSVQGQVRPS